MPYVIITRSAPATLAQREALRPAHIEHLRRHQHLLLLPSFELQAAAPPA